MLHLAKKTMRLASEQRAAACAQLQIAALRKCAPCARCFVLPVSWVQVVRHPGNYFLPKPCTEPPFEACFIIRAWNASKSPMALSDSINPAELSSSKRKPCPPSSAFRASSMNSSRLAPSDETVRVNQLLQARK